MGLTSAIGVLEGTDSKFFAISLVFSLIVSGGACAAVAQGPRRARLIAAGPRPGRHVLVVVVKDGAP